MQTVGRKLTQQSARIQKKSSWIDSNVRNKYKLKKNGEVDIDLEIKIEEESIVEDSKAKFN